MMHQTPTREDALAAIFNIVVRRAVRGALLILVAGLAFLLTYVQMTRTQMLEERRVALDRYLDGTCAPAVHLPRIRPSDNPGAPLGGAGRRRAPDRVVRDVQAHAREIESG